MGFSNEDVTDADRKRAAEISYDMGLSYAGAEEEGKDSGAAAERELAYHIGLIRAQEREKFADVVEALQSLLAFADECSINGVYISEAFGAPEVLDKARAALDKAAK